jgi:hypothetical protein
VLDKLVRRLGKVSLSKSEAQKAFSDAIALVKKIFTEAKAQNPQLELKFQLNEK